MIPSKLLEMIFNGHYPERLLVRVDAGSVKGLSFGHLSRCLTLCAPLKKKGVKIRFLMRDYPEGIAFAEKNLVQVKKLPKESTHYSANELWLEETIRFKPDWTFIDLPYHPFPFAKICTALKKYCPNILFIDDSRFISPNVDTILNTSILAPLHTRMIRRNTRYLLGLPFFIFNPPPQKISGKIPFKKKQIVISFGGSDPTGLTFKAVSALKKTRIFDSRQLQVIMGPGFRQKQPKKTGSFFSQYTDVCLIEAPTEIYSFFLAADMVICSGGRTLYELNELKIPAFPIASIPHEQPVVSEFIRQGLVMDGLFKWNETQFLEKIPNIIGHL